MEFPARRARRGCFRLLARTGGPLIGTSLTDSQKKVLSEKQRGDGSSEDGSAAPSKMDEIPG